MADAMQAKGPCVEACVHACERQPHYMTLLKHDASPPDASKSPRPANARLNQPHGSVVCKTSEHLPHAVDTSACNYSLLQA